MQIILQDRYQTAAGQIGHTVAKSSYSRQDQLFSPGNDFGITGDQRLAAHGSDRFINLHERAGNTNVIHMHGELLKVRCSQSGQVLDWTGDVTPEDKCHCCQFPAPLRPHVVWFGEMPLGMDEIYMALSMADIFIAIGTSGHVYPAAGFVHEAKLHGAHTVELNLEPSQVGNEFAEKYYGPASQVVPEFVEKLLKGLKAGSIA